MDILEQTKESEKQYLNFRRLLVLYKKKICVHIHKTLKQSYLNHPKLKKQTILNEREKKNPKLIHLYI